VKTLLAGGMVLVAVVAGVVFLWPAPASGPEPIAYGRDACAWCRMLISRPGFAGELRAPDGTLAKYDDVGCLLRGLAAAHHEMPEAWVEDHASGRFVSLLSASLVHRPGGDTPMGSGFVAFADAQAAHTYAAAHAARVMTLADVLHDRAVLAQLENMPAASRRTP
jgi:copper chaperone NosL